MPATGSERRSSVVAGGMDTSRRLSASSDCSLPDRDRQLLQEHVENIPTRLPKLTSSKPAANPLQFVKVGPCDLYRSAQEQIRKVEEVKKIKQKRDEAEDWQSNLDNWKNSRRKRQEHIIERVVEVKKFELEEFDRNRKRSKTFNEMMEERTNRGRKVSLVLYKDDDDKDLSDLGIGANTVNKSNGTGSGDNLDMVGNEDSESSQGDSVILKDMNGSQENSVTSQEPQEFTYEQAIQSYVNFAETRVKSKANFRSEKQSIKDVNFTARSEEKLNDVGIKKEKTPPPVAPKPRKYSLKLEEKVNSSERKNSFPEGNDHLSDTSRKLSLPQVDVLKRREVFEKSLSSKENCTKNKPAELLDSKSVKERLTCLGIESSGVSGKNRTAEQEIKTPRQPQMLDPRKQTTSKGTNINDNKLKQNSDNSLVQKLYRNGTEHSENIENELNSCMVKVNNKPVHSLKEHMQSSAKDESTNNKPEIITDNYDKHKDPCKYSCNENPDLSSNSKTTEGSDHCWLRSESGKNDAVVNLAQEIFQTDRWKHHRSLDSLDTKYCDDVGSGLLERVQSLDGLEHCNSVKDYPLSASSVEMLGSSSNGGDTDREDSGIHTADVSCSISQTDEAGEYGDPSVEMSTAFSHLLLDNNVCDSEVHNTQCVVEEQNFTGFLPPVAKDTMGTTGASRISSENRVSCEREQILVSNVNDDVSFQTVSNVVGSENNISDTENISLMHAGSVHTYISKGDGDSYDQELESANGGCVQVSNNCSASAKDIEFLSDVGKEDCSPHSCEASLAYAESEVVSVDALSDTIRTSISVSKNLNDITSESKTGVSLSQISQPVDSRENAESEIKDCTQSFPCVLRSDISHKPIGKESADSNEVSHAETNETNTGKLLSENPDNMDIQSPEMLIVNDTYQNNSSVLTPSLTGDMTPPLTSCVKENKSPEITDNIKPEEFNNRCTVNDMSESSDRNFLVDSNTSNSQPEILVGATSEVAEIHKQEEEEQEVALVQKTENNFVDVESGDGKLIATLSTCISSKDPLSGAKDSKEELKNGYAEEVATATTSVNQKYITSGSLRNDQMDEVLFNDRICMSSSNAPSNTHYDDHAAQKPSDMLEETNKCLHSADIITKDLRNLRIPESPAVSSVDPIASAAELKESHVIETSQVICQIPPLNLSGEVEIVAGLTFPLGPVTAAEPPKEKPPPPPPPSDLSDDEQMQKGSGLQRIDSTRRIKKEIRRKRTNFLGIEGTADDSYLEPELQVAPPPDMTTFLMEEQRLQKQLYRQSICSESDSNLGETTDSRDSGVELEKGTPDDIWAPKAPSTPDTLSVNHSRQNSEIYGNASIASEDDEIAKKEREIIEILEKEEQWRHGHSPHNHEDSIGEELTEKLWQLEQDNLRLEWEKEAKRRELEETVQRREEAMREKEREIEFQRHEAMLQMEQTRLEREAEVIARQKDLLQQPQQWGNKGRLSLQDVSVIRHPVPKNSAHFSSRNMLPEHCQSLPDLQQKQEQDWKPHSPAKSVSSHYTQATQQDWREKENYNRSSWTPAFSPITQQKDLGASEGNHIQGQQMTRQTLQALSAVPRSRLIPTDNWIQAKRKPESKRGTFNSQHWLIQEAEQRRITEQQQRNAMASQKMPTSQLSQPLHWMHQQPQQKKPLPDSVINTLTQRVQNKVDNKKYTNRTRTQDSQSREQVAGHHNIPRTNSNPGGMNTDQTEKMLSVSGKKKCSHCGEELGRGAAMIIESLRLFYHIDCFKCCVCHIQLGDGLMGTDVRVRNNKLHCHNCYSSEDGVKFSCV